MAKPKAPETARKMYEGFAYRQSRDPDAPWIVTFVCPAEELTTWAGIPQRTDQTVLGFQRPEDVNRVEKAKEFFNLGINQSPTAIVVGLHPPVGDDKRVVRLEFIDTDESLAIRRCRLVVEWDSSVEANVEEVVRRIRRQLTARLALSGEPEGDGAPNGEPEVAAAGGEAVPAEDLPEGVEEDIEETGVVEDEADDEEIELGRSLIETLLAKLDDSAWCAQNIDALREMSRPATIIDGQHRIRGASNCERNIPFTLCAIYDCPWPEQIFQFTVVNYTAKGIPDQFITANAALSLTRAELGDLQKRLVQAGVKVVEYDLMRVVNFDSRSPFCDLVNLTEKKDPTKIGYKTMVNLAKAWYAAKNPAFAQLLPNLYPSVIGSRAKRIRIDRWKADDWGDFFIDFWISAHMKYRNMDAHEAGHKLWAVGHSNLLIAIVLVELQDAFFRNLGSQDEEFFEVSKESDAKAKSELQAKLKRRAEKFLEWIPAEFFATKWGIKSLNTSAGRGALSQAVQSLVDTKGRYQYQKSALVTGQLEKK
jgi:hypothetical protein